MSESIKSKGWDKNQTIFLTPILQLKYKLYRLYSVVCPVETICPGCFIINIGRRLRNAPRAVKAAGTILAVTKSHLGVKVFKR